MATGVLLVCLGQATRVSEYLMAGRKRYRATIVLGTATDTYDVEGEVVSSGGFTAFSRSEIETNLAAFVGQIEQVPPIYSALKRGGQPLYQLARQGKKVELEPRPVEIDEIALLDWTSPVLIVEMACSPGTYIRSLAHDLGKNLGCGAYLASLVRLSSGHFSLNNAVSLERLEEAFQYGQESVYLHPMDEALLDLPAMIVGTEEARRVVQGQALRGEPPSSAENSLSRAYTLEGHFLAIMAYHPTRECWQPKKVFASS
jgi:tRNA pseudouridine55 synthase